MNLKLQPSPCDTDEVAGDGSSSFHVNTLSVGSVVGLMLLIMKFSCCLHVKLSSFMRKAVLFHMIALMINVMCFKRSFLSKSLSHNRFRAYIFNQTRSNLFLKRSELFRYMKMRVFTIIFSPFKSD